MCVMHLASVKMREIRTENVKPPVKHLLLDLDMFKVLASSPESWGVSGVSDFDQAALSVSHRTWHLRLVAFRLLLA